MKVLPKLQIINNAQITSNAESNLEQKRQFIDNAYLFASLADLAYQSLGVVEWKLDVKDSDRSTGKFLYFDDCLTTRGFIVKTIDDHIIVVFRGSEIETLRAMFEDWANVDFKQALVPFTTENKAIKVHEGFLMALNNVWTEEAVEALYTELAKDDTGTKKIWFTGHSLGAALATLAACRWAAKFGTDRIGGVYTFGSPKCGNTSFVNYYHQKLLDRTFRFVNRQDIVPAVPLTDPSYKSQFSFWAGYSAYGTFGYLSKQLGENIRDSIYSLTGTTDNHYDHVGNSFYLNNEDGKITSTMPSTFARISVVNPLRLSSWVFDHDYKEYVRKITGAAEKIAKDNTSGTIQFSEHYLTTKAIFSTPYTITKDSLSNFTKPSVQLHL